MNRLLITLFFSLIYIICNSQSIERELLFQDIQDSILYKATKEFDIEGGYKISSQQNELIKIYTSDNTTDLLKSSGGGSGPWGDYEMYTSIGSIHGKMIHYVGSSFGTSVYGPINIPKSFVSEWFISQNEKFIAARLFSDDSVRSIINGEISEVQSKGYKHVENYALDWIYMNGKGEYINQKLDERKVCYLFLNDSIIIDSSTSGFYDMRINKQKDILYNEGVSMKSNYYHRIKYNGKVYCTVNRIKHSYLLENGSYYVMGDKISKESEEHNEFILINNNLYEGIKDVDHVIIRDSLNYFFSFSRNDSNFIVFSGKEYHYEYEKIYYPNIDDKGNFAFFGLRDYYLYKFVNGKELEKPNSKYGSRSIPVQITPTGESIDVYKTEDSVYVYSDDELLYQLESSVVGVYVNTEDLPFGIALYQSDLPMRNNLAQLQIGNTNFVVFEGKVNLLKSQSKFIDLDIYGDENGISYDGENLIAVNECSEGVYCFNVNNNLFTINKSELGEICSSDKFLSAKGLIVFSYLKGAVYRNIIQFK